MRGHLVQATLMASEDEHKFNRYKVKRQDDSGQYRSYQGSWPMNVQLSASRIIHLEARSNISQYEQGPFHPDSLDDLELAKNMQVYCLLMYSFRWKQQGSGSDGAITKGLAMIKESEHTYKRIGLLDMKNIYYESDESDEIVEIVIV
jgi:hypothetical protein